MPASCGGLFGNVETLKVASFWWWPFGNVEKEVHAYGTPHADSDVDILVIMPAHNELDQAAKIACQVPAPFAEDLIVLKPHNVQWRLEAGDSFLTEIMTNGKVLYEKDDPRVGAKGRSLLPPRREDGTRRRAVS